jgi:hypothetical protein
VSNWWANKLGTPQPQQAPSYPQPTQQGMATIPQHLMPPGAVQQPAQQQGMFQIGAVVAPVQQWLGGNRKNGAARAGEVHNCPECNSVNYFDRSKVPGATKMTDGGKMVSAAPLCMDCGYRGMYIPQQYGELHDALLLDDENAG